MKIIKNRTKNLFKSKFIQDVGFLQISTIIIAAILALTALIIAKGLKPEEFGIYSLALSLYGLIGILGNTGAKQMSLLKLPAAYIAQDKEEIISLIAYYFKLSLFTGALIMVIGYAGAPHLSQLLYGRQDIGSLARIFCLMPLSIILYKLVGVILEGTRNMRYLAITECVSELLKSLILITIVTLGLGLNILAYGWVISAIVSSILAVFMYKNLRFIKKGFPSISGIVKKSYIQNSRRFLRFNISMGFSENIISLNENLPIILLGVFVLPKEVGYFKLGFSIIGILSLFLEPIARNLLVRLKELAGSRNIKGLSEAFYKVSLYSGIISILLVALIIFLYHFLIYFLLKDYEPSLKIVYILAVYFCLMGFGVALSPALRALERLDIEIKANAIGILIFVALTILFIKNLGISGMGIALVISTLCAKFMMYLSLRETLGKFILDNFKIM